MSILTTANYLLWAPAMEDYLRAKGMWYWIHHSPPDERTDPKGNRKCLESQDQAVGEIRHHLSPELRSVALASSDPQSILDAIKAAYGASSFATRHNALQALLAVLKVMSCTGLSPIISLSCPLYDSLAPNPLWESVAFLCPYDLLMYSLYLLSLSATCI